MDTTVAINCTFNVRMSDRFVCLFFKKGCRTKIGKLYTGYYGQELSWSIGNDACFGGKSKSDGSSNRWGDLASRGWYDVYCCLPAGNHELKCTPKNGFGGWNGGFIEIGGRKYCDRFTSNSWIESITISGDSTSGTSILDTIPRQTPYFPANI